MDGRTKLIGDDVLAALAPVECIKASLIRRTRVCTLLHLALAELGQRGHESVVKQKCALAVARDFGGSIRTLYLTSTRAWLTVSVLAFRSMSDQRRPSTSPRRRPYSESR